MAIRHLLTVPAFAALLRRLHEVRRKASTNSWRRCPTIFRENIQEPQQYAEVIKPTVPKILAKLPHAVVSWVQETATFWLYVSAL